MRGFKASGRRKGFTLVELLVVIAILAILATISMIIFNGVQKKGRITKRINDLKSIQAALELYKSENGHYPNSTTGWSSECATGGSKAPNDVIPGLVPTYLQSMPSDPLMDKTNDRSCYIYSSQTINGATADYKIIDHNVAEFSAADYMSHPELFDPLRDHWNLPDDQYGTPDRCKLHDGAGSWAWAVYSPGGKCF